MRWIIFSLCLALVILVGSAQAISDNLFFSIPNDTLQCIEVTLPDDMDILEEGISGTAGYKIETTMGRWGDLTEQTVWTNENNTALIPICFRVKGKKPGECSEPFNISINSPEINRTKSWNGGICVSDYRDVDSSPESRGDVADVLNTEKDIFTIGFREPVKIGTPGEDVVFRLLFESYADVKLIVSVESDVGVFPEKEVITLSKTSPKKILDIKASAQSGEHEIIVSANIMNCYEDYCRKTSKAKLIISETIPDSTGFRVRLFPENINVKYLDPVLFELTITNFGETADFETILLTQLESDFDPGTITLENEARTIFFSVTPEEYSQSYELKATVRSGNTTKHAIAYLTTNEMLSDVAREMGEAAEPYDREAIGAPFDDFVESYRENDYGQEIDDYKDLKTVMANAKSGNATGDDIIIIGDPEPEQGFDWLMIIIPIIIAILVIVIIIIYKKGLLSGKEAMDQNF